MIKIVNHPMDDLDKTTVLKSRLVRETARKAIETIKNELPEEAQTVEVLEYIISEMKDVVKESRICL